MPEFKFFKIEFLNEDDMNQYIDDYLENDYPGYMVYQMNFDTVKSRYVLLLQLRKRI